MGTGAWSVASNPSAIAPVFSPSVNNPGSTVAILPGNEGIYRFAWTIINGSCRTSDTLLVDFGMPVPPADAGIPDSVCGNEATLNGNNPGIGTGTWKKITGTGNPSYIPGHNSPVTIVRIPAGDEGFYSFEWRITSGSCPPSADTVGILFKPMPGNPAATDAERCGPGSVTLLSTPGLNADINRWYENSSGGSILSESNNFTTPVLISANDYWVSSYNMATGCESYRRQVNVNIYPVPEPPVVSNMQHCGNVIVSIPATVGNNGTTNRWYDAATGGNLLAEEDTFTTPMLSAPITYWVSSYNEITGCESNRIPVAIQIDPIPGLPASADTSRCGEGTLTIQSLPGINGTHNQWFDAPAGGNLIDTTLNMITPYLTSSTPYWVSSLNTTTGCRSPRLRVMANIHPIPDYPVAPDVTQCGADTVVLYSSPGSNGTTSRWYDSLTGGSLLIQGNDYVTNYLTSTQRYYVSSYNENTRCESSRREVMAVILPVPAANSILGPAFVGINQTNVIYSVNYQPGSTYDWTVPPGMNLLLENQNFVIVEFPNLGNYNLSVVETNSIGCVGPPATKPIEVRVDVIALDINTTHGEACSGSNLQLSVSPYRGNPVLYFCLGRRYSVSEFCEQFESGIFFTGSRGLQIDCNCK